MIGDEEYRAGIWSQGEFGLIKRHVQLQQTDGGIEKDFTASHAFLVLEIQFPELALAVHFLDGVDYSALQGGLA